MSDRTNDQLKIDNHDRFVKTMTEDCPRPFAGMIGDFNPTYIEMEYARKTILRRRIAYGILQAGSISAVIAMRLPDQEQYTSGIC